MFLGLPGEAMQLARSFRRFFLAGVAALSLVGCAEEREPINRVQPNALEKSFFVGRIDDENDDPEFYFRSTIVDVDYGTTQDLLWTPIAGSLTRVHWEVTEDLLLARLAYDRIDNTSQTVDEGSAGVVVAAFPIEKHFDIQRDYNSQTGEELNVVVENTADRPWYQREFMRVDWSENRVTTSYDFDILSLIPLISDMPVTYEPASYYVQDPTSPDVPVFAPQQGYFDVTNKVYVRPELINTPFGAFPACFLSPDVFSGTNPDGNCNASEVKVRLAFRRVADTDYEPIDWDGTRQNMFGIINYTHRFGYDRNYGVVDDRWQRFASRHNIWAQSHARATNGRLIPCYTAETTPAGANPQRDEDFDGTHDECQAAGQGSRCDPYTHACTLPYASRRVKPIVFYYGLGGNPDLFEEVSAAVSNWDGALRHAVQTSRYTECVRGARFSHADIDTCKQDYLAQGDTAGYASCAREKRFTQSALDQCRELYPTTLEDAMANVPLTATLCHNPVIEGDAEACGPRGLVARMGDIRYHLISAIHEPQSGQPWGVQIDGTDPLTGEVVAASVNIFEATTEKMLQDTIDKLRWQLGELSNEAAAAGAYAAEVSVAGARAFQDRGPPLISKREAKARLSAMDQSLAGPKQALPAKLNETELVRWAAAVTTQRFGEQAVGRGNANLVSRMNLAKQSGLELELVTQPFLQMGGSNATTALSSSMLDQLSPLRGNFFSFRAELAQARQLANANAGRCELEAPEPTNMAAWSRILDQKFPLADRDPNLEGIQASAEDVIQRNDRWRDFLRRKMTFSVISHEIGHSLGLAHVFTSSADALNYRPQYWQLRTRDGAENALCTDAVADGASCVGPRWLDPVTPEEENGLIHRWMHTSVMEYPGELTQDTLDISAYDRAAIRFAYGDVTEVWDDANVRCGGAGAGSRRCTRGGEMLQARLDSFGGILGPVYGLFTQTSPIHYSALQNELGLIRNCRAATEEELSPPASWNEARDGAWSAEFDGQIVNGTMCEGAPVDYVSYSDLEFDQPGFAQQETVRSGAVRKFDPLGRVRRPYLYAGDQWADLGNVAVFRHDNGADPYETAHFLINAYEDNHLFENHRRSRTSFSLRNSHSRQVNRYHFKLMEMAKGWALLNELFTGAGIRPILLDDPEFDTALKANALSSTIVFDHFASMLTRPSSGEHANSLEPGEDRRRVLRSTDQLTGGASLAPVMVPEGTTMLDGDTALGGRPLNNKLDDSKGYYASDYPLWVGSYYDKAIAAALLTDSFDRFIPDDRDTFFDGRYRNVGMASLFPDGVRRLIATALTEDKAMLGWRVAASVNGAGGVQPLLDANRTIDRPFGQRAWWAKEPVVCWPRSGRVGCFDFTTGEGNGGADAPAGSIPVDPEVGFEIQKFVAFWSMLYLPESWKLDWVDMMRIWKLGGDSDPSFPDEQRLVWRDPQSSQVYVAHRYGPEVIDGREVDRGIAARVVEWMNVLTRAAYEVDGDPDPDTGELTVRRYGEDDDCPEGVSTCVGQPVQRDVTMVARVRAYKTMLDYLHDITGTFGFGRPELRGIY
jgi:hypothetical protein